MVFILGEECFYFCWLYKWFNILRIDYFDEELIWVEKFLISWWELYKVEKCCDFVDLGEVSRFDWSVVLLNWVDKLRIFMDFMVFGYVLLYWMYMRDFFRVFFWC